LSPKVTGEPIVPARRAGWRRVAEIVVQNGYVRAIAVIGLTLALGLAVRARLNPIDVVMLFLLAVVIVAATEGRGPAVLTVLLATALFDFFFVPPYGTFSVLDQSFGFTFGVMFVVALIMSGLTGRIRSQALEAQRGEARASALYEMVRDLAATSRRDEQRVIAARHLAAIARGEAEVVLADGMAAGQPLPPSLGADSPLSDIEIRAAADWAVRHGQPAGWGTIHSAGAESLVIPLTTGGTTLGVAVITPPSIDRVLEDHELRTLEVLAQQAALVMKRVGPASA
jgi:two-component system sensor histidine kinase KdpD